MNTKAKLTSREWQIAELLAWGASKREIAIQLFISERTVENHTRNIYERIGITRVNELSAWYFCTRHGISFDLSPIKRQLVAIAMMFIIMPQAIMQADEMVRTTRSRVTRRCSRRRGEEGDILNFDGILMD